MADHCKLSKAEKYIWGYSSVGRAPALQAGGREFESLYLHLLSKESRTLYLENCIYETSKNTLNVDRDENEALRKQRIEEKQTKQQSHQILTL